MSDRLFAAHNRWFILGILFLLVNGYGVWLYRASLAEGRGLRATLTAPRSGCVTGQDVLRWRFSADMVAPSATGVWSAAGPVKFLPDVQGAFGWATPRELVFRPDKEWKPCVNFKAIFSDELRGAGLEPLVDGNITGFHTESLAVKSVTQADFSESGGLRLHIEFNAEVDPGAFCSAVSVADASGNPLQGSVEQQHRGKVMALTLPRDPQGDVTLRLKAGLQSTAGPRGLEHDLVWTIKPTRELKVVRVEQETRSFGPNNIYVSFNRPLVMDSVASCVAVEPPLDITVEAGARYSWRPSNSIRIAGAFAPNRSYTVTLKQGLPGNGGTSLGEDAVYTVYFPDADPALELKASGNYMSPHGSMVLPFRTIGMTKCRVSLNRVYPNNLVYLVTRQNACDDDYYYGSHPGDGLGRDEAATEFAIARDPAAIVEHRFSLKDLTRGQKGAFYVTINASNGKDNWQERHHLVISDTGLSVKQSDGELLVWANSIRTLAPVAGAEIRVFSEANQELISGATDPEGLARLRVGTNDAAGAPFLVSAQKDDDLTYLVLGRSGVEVKGGAGDRGFLAEGYEACLFTDRGIYRPGETTHARAIVRGPDGAAPPPFPVQLRVLRPDGRLEKTISAMLSGYGTAGFDIPWPGFAGTGRYRLELALPGDKKVLGSAHVAVEEFVPPQIKVEVKTDPARTQAGGEISAEVRADYLFGRPAAGLPSEVRVEIAPQPVKFERFPEFEFGDPGKPFQTVRQAAGKAPLDENGSAAYALTVSRDWRPPAALRLLILGTVTEIGGRGVTACAGRDVDVYPFYIGLGRGEEAITTGREHTFSAVTVSPAGAVTSAAARLKLAVEKLGWATVLKKGPDDSYIYCSEKQAAKVHDGEVAFQDGRASFAFTPAGDGDYRLSLRDPASGASSAIEFRAGAPGQHWETRSLAAPDVVELKFDKERYAAGETATLVIKAPFPGKALVTLESSRVLDCRVVALEKNTAELKFPVRADYAPNVYCAVTVIRPAVSEKLWGQHRAAGMAPLAVDAPERRASLALAAPDRIRPCQKLEVGIETTGEDGQGIPAEVVVAAVDEGICMLTDFKTPDPYAFFMAVRRPAVALRDLYSLLMPELEKSVGGEPSSPGGDDLLAGLGKRLNPVKARRFKPVALWSAAVMTDASGRARVEFEVPEFTGQLRLMAVAVDRQRLAAAERKVAVARPLVVQSSLPRFLAPADAFSLPVQILNETGADGEAAVRVACSGPLALGDGRPGAERRIALPKGGCTNLEFRLAAAAAPGQALCRLEVEMAGEKFAEDTELAVRPPAGRTVLAGSGRLAAGKKAALELPANWLEGTAENNLWLSALPSVELGGSLAYLLGYPYGCLEQTTSKSFPLLYLCDLAAPTHPGWPDRREIGRMVQSGIQRVLGMQRNDGSFSMWGNGETYPWGTLYATHFLVAADQAGYPVPAGRTQAACEFIEQWMARKAEVGNSVEAKNDTYDRSYACVVLALAGRPHHGWMTRLAEQSAKLDYDAKVNLASALLAAGKRREGNALLGAIEIPAEPNLARQAGGSLRSNTRADAMLLAAWLEADPDSAAIPGLVHRLEAGRNNGRWDTTQENALALMALGRYSSLLARDRKPISGRVTAGGLPPLEFAGTNEFHAPLGIPGGASSPERASGERLVDKPLHPWNGHVEILNQGDGPIYYYWKSEGVPGDGMIAEEDRGLKVRREILGLDGGPADPAELRQGDLFVIRVILETDNAGAENIIVDDLLPAGLEIENANLKTSQVVGWCKDKQTLALLHADIRDDRMIAFPARFSGNQEYYYAVRAVTPGEFVLPPIAATCMYDPAIRSVHGAGRVRVTNPAGP